MSLTFTRAPAVAIGEAITSDQWNQLAAAFNDLTLSVGAVALAIMVVVLLVRPEGLFGVAFEEER